MTDEKSIVDNECKLDLSSYLSDHLEQSIAVVHVQHTVRLLEHLDLHI